MPITNILSIAKTALMANQNALRVTSNNIANVNTPGYTRQRVNLTPGMPIEDGYFVFGNGVEIESVERVYDQFIQNQIIDAADTLSWYESRFEGLRKLEDIYNDSKGMGLEDVMNGFFTSLEDVANDPQSYAARSALISRATSLADRIVSIDTRTRDEIRFVDEELGVTVETINDLTSQIAELNLRIKEMEGKGFQANDLRDRRDIAIRELSANMDITVLENDEGTIDIMTGKGSSIVAGQNVVELSVKQNVDNHGYNDVFLGNYNITKSIESGKLKGLLDVRDNHLRPTLEKLETLSASLTKEYNAIHSTGFGLDGSTGLDLFTPLAPTTHASSNNTGGAVASASVYDKSLLTLDEYQIKFTGPATFSVYNVTQGTTVSTGNAYVSGANIDIDGIRMVITDASGTPAQNDIFNVNVTENSSRFFGVALSDPRKFAAATDINALPGDNTNVLSMLALRNSNTLKGGTATFSSFYISMISDIGSATANALTDYMAQETVVAELNSYRESISGVSLDEEGVNLIKFQHAYEAAARVITTVDSMFETILRMR